MQLQFSPKEEEILKVISECAHELHTDAYVIGGFVRDKIINRESKDIDIVCIGNGIELAQKVA
ncbi:MAG TPA: tRNA nucleotidyltransferase, partial [Chitinophagales bacterium]|nr:tRNA nucleotidyltransferase [Chitinophagales bacterium]